MCRTALLVLAALCAVTSPAFAVIKALVPLEKVLDEEEFIFVAKVEKVNPDLPAVVFTVTQHLKGKAPLERLPANLTGDSFAKTAKDTQSMLDRLEPGREMIVFTSKNGKKYSAFVMMDGTWFQMLGTLDDDGTTVRWAFLHCEPWFRRTFSGTTAELKTVVTECLAGKRKPPPVDEKAPPGLGPLPEKKKSQRVPGMLHFGTGPLFAVIPSFVLIGPLAIIAALFPGVAARMAVGMRRWRVFFIVVSINSTLALLYWLAAEFSFLPDHPWASGRALAGFMLAVSILGMVFAGRRYRKMAATEPELTGIPTSSELLALGGLTFALGLLVVGTGYFVSWPETISPAGTATTSGQFTSGLGLAFTAIATGLLLATGYAMYRRVTQHTDGTPPPPVRLSLSGESVGLAAMALFTTAVLVGTNRPATVTPVSLGGDVTEAATKSTEIGPKLAGAKVWFETPDYHEVMSGITVADDRLYFGTMRSKSFNKFGAVLCVDRATAKEVWRFDSDGDLMPVFTTPAVSNGRVFTGEGLHTESDRRLFCLDAATGNPVWMVPTTSHTEGSPLVVNGKVYFSAGNDGAYCVNAADGAKVWHLRGSEQKLHIDTPPTLSKGRVFLGSGYNVLALIAMNADTGEELWRVPTKLRSFGPALPLGKNVAFGLGTGNLAEDLSQEPEEDVPPETQPAGAILCLDAATGKEVWRAELPKSVHTELAADARAVYACCRDGAVYAFDRTTGQRLWTQRIGSAITSAPALVAHFGGAVSLAVYAVSSDGFVACLSPRDGRVMWSRNLGEVANGRDVNVLSGPTVVVSDPSGSRREVFLGAMLTNRNNRAKAAAVFRLDDEVSE